MAYGYGDTPIVIWAYGSYTKLVETAIAHYQEHIDSEVIFEVKNLTPSQIYDRLDSYKNINELPNIILVDDQELKKYLKKFNGVFATFENNLNTDFYTNCKLANITSEDGLLYGCPCSSEPVALFYNKDLLQYIGAEENLPDDITWDEFIEIGKQLREAAPDVYLLPPANHLVRILMQSTGQLYYDVDGNISGNGSREVMELIQYLYEEDLLYPESVPSSTTELIATGKIFSIIAESYWFPKIKQIVEEQSLEQKWCLTHIPKSETFCCDVDIGGLSWLVVNKTENEEEQQAQRVVFDFLLNIFNQNNECSKAVIQEMAGTYDIVPAVNFVGDILDKLDNNGCFTDKQVIKYLYEISTKATEIYYGEYTEDITQVLNESVDKIIFEGLDIDLGYAYFIQYCNYYSEQISKRELSYIVIEREPNKREYLKYEHFSPDGMIVRAYYTDGTNEIVTNYVYPGELFLNTILVEIEYKSGGVSKSEYVSVKVIDRTMTSITASSWWDFYQGDKLDPSAFSVQVFYDMGNSRTTKATSVSPTVLTSTGNTVVTVYYKEDGLTLSTTKTITVYKKLKRITISKNPNKLSYYKGESFDRTGLGVIAHYSDGSMSNIPSGNLIIEPKRVNFTNWEESTLIRLSYKDRSITQDTYLKVYKKTGVDLDDCDITQDMADSGIGSVNLSTGQLTYTFDDFIGYDNVFPIAISHIYKDGIGNNWGMGNNWRLNLQQEIITENDKWKYTDKKGKEHFFDDGYEVTGDRSSIRNEKLNLDLFEDNVNKTVTLIDRNNNSLVFNLINGKYRLVAMHMYPSTPTKPILAYSLNITYADGKIATVTAGKCVNGNRPTVKFIYKDIGETKYLSKLQYVFSGETTIAEYCYDSENYLETITLLNNNTEDQFTHTTKFEYFTTSFFVHDLSSKNNNGMNKMLAYTLDDATKRVTAYYIGYGPLERDVTNIKYSALAVSTEDSSDISLSTVTENNGNASIVSFNSYGVVSQYSYDVEKLHDSTLNYAKPKKITGAQSHGFSYKSLADTYSDTLDIFHDDFEHDINGWAGAERAFDKVISGPFCISGKSLSKSYKLTAKDINNGTTLYLSLWASSTYTISVKVTIAGSESGELIHNLDQHLNKWQFTAICLGKRNIGDTITVQITSGQTTNLIYLDDVRLTKMPYETPEKLADTVVDDFGNVTKQYQYNPIDKCIETTEYTYKNHQVTQQTQKTESGVQKNSIVNTYSNGLLTFKKEYGQSETNYTQEQYIYSDYILSSTLDVNNVVTKYSDGQDYAETTICGETNSPDIQQKEERFANSGVIKLLSSGNLPNENTYTLQNGYTYFANGNLKKTQFNYSSTSNTYKAEFAFEYDTFGNLSALKIGTVSLVTMEYNYKHLNKTTYANGDCVAYTYDEKDRITEIAENGENVISVTYSDNSEDLVTVTHSNGLTYTSKSINKNGKTGEYCARFTDIDRILKVTGYAANDTGNITTVGYFVDDSDTPFEKCISTKDGNGLLTKLERSYHGAQNTYTYDDLYRLSSKTTTYNTNNTKKEYKTVYAYNTLSGNRKGTRITAEKHYKGSTLQQSYKYNYYKNDCLKSITLGDDKQNEYIYDKYGRLICENNYALSRSYRFTYDNGGNIVKKETYYITNGIIDDSPTQTDTYDYDTVTTDCGQNSAWKDQLKSYNGTAITYDESGNPLNYRSKVMSWQGRNLTAIDGIAMAYDYNSLRVKKGDKTYYWQSGKLVMERWLKNGAENYIYYYYDESGVCGMNYNGAEYYYRKNILGDVIAIYDNLGNTLCKYVYDAWGNHKVYNTNGSEIGAEVLNIGNINPFRYRGYYWDQEFSLYYLQTRYYDPSLGRFISPDAISYIDPESVAGFNLYAYCGNNPIMGTDPSGTIVAIAVAAIIGAVIGTVVGATGGAITAASTGQNIFEGALIGALGGAIMGAGAGAAGFLLAPVLAGASTIGAGSALFLGTSIAFISGAAGGMAMDTVTQIANYGTITDGRSIAYSGLQYGFLNVFNAFLSAGYLPAEIGMLSLQSLSINFGINALTGVLGSLIDIIRNRVSRSSQNLSLIELMGDV